MKKQAMGGNLESNKLVNEMIEDIKKRYEIESLQGLRDREQSLNENLTKLRNVLKNSNLEMNKQEVLLNQDLVELNKLENKKKEIAHQISVDSALKKDV